MSKVFISYSHDPPEHEARVRGLHASLSRDGCEPLLDFYNDTDEDWPTWMTRQLIEADFVLCVVTATYARRFSDRELPNAGLGVGWEAGLIKRLLYAKKLHNARIFPVLFEKADQDHIPLELQGYDYFLLDDPAGYERLLRKVLKSPAYTAPQTGQAPDLPTEVATPLFARPGETPTTRTTGLKADLSRILKYAPAQLIGREAEMQMLHDAWAGQFVVPPSGGAPFVVPPLGGPAAPDRLKPGLQTTRPHLLTLVALGGEGKTALVAKWAAELAAQDWPGCDAAFAWSFYSQGTREQQAASSDLFLKAALTFFGDDADQAFAASPAGAFEKGQRLARLVGQRRSLLILDGLEPLQYAPTAPTPGELKDQGLAALLKGLAAASHGLCVVTTRYSLPDLKAFWQTTAPEVKLLRLSPDAGVHLLQTLGVRGTAQEFATLVEDVKGHALTLTLLGGFLKRAFHGDIRQRDRVKFEKADEKMDGGHAFRTMAAYEQWLLRDGGDEGRREVAVVRLMGLFDRPAEAGCLAALRREPIPGLTEPLTGLAEDDWEYCLSGLEAAKLLTVNRDASGALVSLDAHPHLREYFARQLRARQLDVWRAAHRRLYEHLCATTKEGDQPTLEDLQPLYQAVAHGCQAGLQREAFYQVFYARIKREGEHYSAYKLGALASDLGATAHFFQEPWARISAPFGAYEQASLFNFAAFYLRALGRLTEALEPMRAGIKLHLSREKLKEAAINASNLSELELTLGEVAGAVGDAEQSVTYADRSGDAGWKEWSRTTLANALNEAGRTGDSVSRFREAEELQKSVFPDFRYLFGEPGFSYCSSLLLNVERGAWQCQLGRANEVALTNLVRLCRQVEERALTVSEFDKNRRGTSLLEIALDHLTLGRAALYAAILERSAAVSVGPAAATPNAESASGSSNGFFPADAAAGGASPTPALQSLQTARRELDAAVSGLRRASAQEFIVRGLLTRAWLRFLEGSRTGPDSAQADLDEAWEIAERGPMRLHMADIHLHRARLFGCRMPDTGCPYPWESPKADLAAARRLIEQCGYGRRKEELEDAEKAIGVG